MERNVWSPEMITNIAKLEKYIQRLHMLVVFCYLPGKALPQAIHLPQEDKLGESGQVG